MQLYMFSYIILTKQITGSYFYLFYLQCIFITVYLSFCLQKLTLCGIHQSCLSLCFKWVHRIGNTAKRLGRGRRSWSINLFLWLHPCQPLSSTEWSFDQRSLLLKAVFLLLDFLLSGSTSFSLSYVLLCEAIVNSFSLLCNIPMYGYATIYSLNFYYKQKLRDK